MDVSAQDGIGARVLSALRTASRTTGIDFGYLAATARRESAFIPDAKAPTSSATGLFQFIDQTWLRTLRESGAELGYAEQAQAIAVRRDGSLTVPDGTVRQDIMDLRKDPVAASLMAGALTQSNAVHLRQSIGREPSDGELYIAHFLGAGGASRLINAAEATPDASAARMFPAAAKSNRSIFYERDGSVRSVAEVHHQLVSKHLDTQSAALALSGGQEVGGAGPMASAVPDPQRAVSRVPMLEDGARAGVFADLFRPAVQTGLGSQAQQRLAMASGVQSLFTTDGASGTSPPRVAPPGVAPPRVEPVMIPASFAGPTGPAAIDEAGRLTIPVFDAPPNAIAGADTGSMTADAGGAVSPASVSENRAVPERRPDPVQSLLRGIARLFGFRAG